MKNLFVWSFPLQEQVVAGLEAPIVLVLNMSSMKNLFVLSFPLQEEVAAGPEAPIVLVFHLQH